MELWLPTLSLIGTAIFAASGALAGLRNRLDIVGIAFVATLTGIGGGTVRDFLLGDTPLEWVREPLALIICLVVAVTVAALNPWLRGRRLSGLTIADALGLALFAVLGAGKALALGAHPFVAILLGAMTASFGGIIRDIVCNEKPLFLQREIYITAALVGAAIFVFLPEALGFDLRALSGFVGALSLRLLAIAYNWSLPFPRYRNDP